MARLLSAYLLLLISVSGFCQSPTYQKLVAASNFVDALAHAVTPMEQVVCLSEMEKWKQADSILATFELSKEDLNYAKYCLIQGRSKIKKKKNEAAKEWLQKGFESAIDGCVIKNEILENQGYLLIRTGQREKGALLIEQALANKLACGAPEFDLIKSYSQNSIASFFKTEYETGIDFIDKALVLMKPIAPSNFYWGKLLGNKGVFYSRLGKIEESRNCNLLALENKKKYLEDPLDVLFTPNYINLSINSSRLKDFEKFKAYNDTLELIQLNGPNDPVALSSIYVNKAIHSDNLITKELELRKAIAFNSKLDPIDKKNIVTAYSYLGSVYGKKRNFAEAENYYIKALSVLKEIPLDTRIELAEIYQKQGFVAIRRYQYDKAERLLKKGLQLHQEVYGKNHPELVNFHGYLGTVYLNTKQYEKSESHLQKNISLAIATFGKESPNLGYHYARLGILEEARGNYEKAIGFLQKAIPLSKRNVMVKREVLPNTYAKLSEAYIGLENKPAALQAQFDLLKEWKFNIEDNLLKDAHSVPDYYKPQSMVSLKEYFLFKSQHDTLDDSEIEVVTQMFKELRSDYFFEISAFEFKESSNRLFDICIEDQITKWNKTNDIKYVKSIYELMEIYKSSLLDRSFLDNFDSEKFNLPTELIAKEKEIRYQYEKAHQEFQLMMSDTSILLETSDSIQNELSKWQNEKINFISDLKDHYPDYYNKGHQDLFLPFEQLKKQLKEKKLQYLSHFWGEKQLYSLFISANDCFVFQNSVDSITVPIQNTISKLSKSGINNSELDFAADKLEFIKDAKHLYEKLYAPIESYLNSEAILCVIPDYLLCYLPFDVLLTNEVNVETSSFRDLPYLIRQKSLIYDTSISSNQFTNSKKHSKKYNYVGFAPSSNGQPSAKQLRNEHILFAHTKEVEKASKLFNGKGYYGGDANKTNFLEFAAHTDILHLATHAKVNDSIPMNSALFFNSIDESEQLKIHEIAQLELNNQLVILSACETQFGQFAQGEGLLSIARAFQLAGSPNLINTLWPVNDQCAEKIISPYLANLKIGNGQSLRQSKLDYLKNSNELYAHPSYWAAFSFHGQEQPMEMTSARNFSSWILAAFLGFILLFGFKFIKK